MSLACGARFVVLASGSGGNAAVVETAAGSLLIDFGLAPQNLERRLRSVGLTWTRIRAAVLTHTHTDHWKRETLAVLASHGIPVFGHSFHSCELDRAGDTFAELKCRSLWQPYELGRSFEPIDGIYARPVAVPHDCDPTAAFRFDGRGWSIGYAADLGTVPAELADAFDGVDLMGLEFNHDEKMQRTSRRPEFLIRRVLGSNGHLSNNQAVEFLRRFHDRCGDRLRHVVQLHLSRECNRPALAVAAGRSALVGTAVQLTTASQDLPTEFLVIGTPGMDSKSQPSLPGLES